MRFFKGIPVIDPNIEFNDVVADKISKSSYVYLMDHMPETRYYDFVSGFKDSYRYFFEKYNIDYANKIFICDHYLNLESLDRVIPNVDLFDKGNFFVWECKNFLKEFKNHKIDFQPIGKMLSFMSNKSRPNRCLTSKVIANYFDINSINYSYVNNLGQQGLANELLKNIDQKLIDKFLPEQWFYNKNETHNRIVNESRIDHSTNTEQYKILKDCLFVDSAISIISEPCFFEKGTIFTEKTLMAIYSGHFMIWPGMYKSAETFSKFGFDIFDDIIDHSYQYNKDPGLRVLEAFTKNIKLLNNLELQNKFRYEFQSRLLENFNHSRDITGLNEKILDIQIGNAKLDNRLELEKIKRSINV